MTTDPDNRTPGPALPADALAIWNALNEGERAALCSVTNMSDSIFAEKSLLHNRYISLQIKGLTTFDAPDHLTDLGRRVLLASVESAQPGTVTAKELYERREFWGNREIAGECHFIYKDCFVDKIGEYNGAFIIVSQCLPNDYEYVNGDVVIGIEWLQPHPATQAAADSAGAGEDDDEDVRSISDDDIQRTINQMPAVRAEYALRDELEQLRAQFATASRDREALKLVRTQLSNILYNLKQSNNYEAKDLIPSLEAVLSSAAPSAPVVAADRRTTDESAGAEGS